MAPALLVTTISRHDFHKPSFTLTPPLTPPDDKLPTAFRDWQDIAEAKQTERESVLAMHPEWRLSSPPSDNRKDVRDLCHSNLSSREKEIVHLDATALVKRIRLRHYTSVEVTVAFCKVATVAQDLTNCLTEIFFEEAIAHATELDRYLDTTGQVIGPLHGLPVSIKDHVLMKGKDTSSGYISWAFNTVANKDSVVVQLLRRAGAVLYVKTANPQTLLSLETENNVFGQTQNPWNRSLTPGGSSGGESALVCALGSPLGVGTDIGGSIRVPAAHCGVYGLKGSVARFPHAGLLGSHDGMEAIIGALGPLASSARDLALWCKVMLLYEPWYVEPTLLNMPWKEDIVRGVGLRQKSCFAILWDDEVVLPHPPITSALKQVKAALQAAGHEVIDWMPTEHQQAWDLIVQLYLLDAGKEYRETMSDAGEPGVAMTQWMLSHGVGRKPFTPEECFQLNARRDAFRTRIMTQWNATAAVTSSGMPVDAILCPVASTLAPAHGTTRWWGYSSYWNLLDYPGVVFPIGKFSASEYEGASLSSIPRNFTESYVHKQWCPETFQGAPISLQLVGRRHEEEKLLAMLDRVEDALKCQN